MNTSLQTPLQVQRIQAIDLTVADGDRSIDFYTAALGFTVISDQTVDSRYNARPGTPLSRVRVITLKLGDEHIRLMQYLDIHSRSIPEDSQSNDLWFQHLAIVVSDMDQAYAHLQSFPFEPISMAPQTIPPGNKEAAYIQAFKFQDCDRHPLELIWFPPDKGQAKWHQNTNRLFLGIDHTAIAVADTKQSLQFYCDRLGMRIDGGSFNWRETQARMDGLPNAKVRITALRPIQGGLGIELLDYIEPANGRPIPSDLNDYDIANTQIELVIDDINPVRLNLMNVPYLDQWYQMKDPTGHSLLLRPATHSANRNFDSNQ